VRAVLTRVSEATVTVDGETVGAIDCPDTGGLLALVGVSREDMDDWQPRAEKMARKIAELRILDGEVSVIDAAAPVLVVSQFTLYGRTAKGRRPAWADAAPEAPRGDDTPTIREVSLATDPNTEGEATAAYLVRLLRDFPDLKITRLASGMPLGGDLEFVDELTLSRALSGRLTI